MTTNWRTQRERERLHDLWYGVSYQHPDNREVTELENEFFNAAHEAVPQLLAEVERLERELAERLPNVVQALSNLRPPNLPDDTCFDAPEDCGHCSYCKDDE